MVHLSYVRCKPNIKQIVKKNGKKYEKSAKSGKKNQIFRPNLTYKKIKFFRFFFLFCLFFFLEIYTFKGVSWDS